MDLLSVQKIAQNFISSAIEKGLSANATLNLLRETGLGYKRQTFLTDFRNLAGVPAKASLLKYVRPEFRPSANLMTQGGFWMKNQFRYVTKLDVLIPSTGETITLHKNISTDEQLTRAEAEQFAIDNFNENMPVSQPVLQKATLTAVYARTNQFNSNAEV